MTNQDIKRYAEESDSDSPPPQSTTRVKIRAKSRQPNTPIETIQHSADTSISTDNNPAKISTLARIISPHGNQHEDLKLPRLPELSHFNARLHTVHDSSVEVSSAVTVPPEIARPSPEQRRTELHPIYSAPIWPLTDPSEALLLRHFVQNLAIWVNIRDIFLSKQANSMQLDLCDPKQHFQTEVPQRAGTCQILLNAIFALSSRHLSRVQQYDSYASNRYHQECLKCLIPMLSDTATVADESLFAATIILRVLEELDSK